MKNAASYPNIKRSLVLAGGGVRLAYQAGAIIALQEEGLTFNHIDGTSGGIFGTAMLASGVSPVEAAERWRNLRLKGFISAMPLKHYVKPSRLPAMGSSEGIRKKVFPALGIDINKINANTAFDATFNVCNFSKKTVESIPHNQVTEDHLVAGMSLPVFMPAVKINDDWYTDAVWIKDANLTEAITRDAEEIYLIWCIGNTATYLDGFFNQYVHMIEISANSALFAEIDLLNAINKQRITSGGQPVKLHIIKPKFPLPLDPDFLLNKINADTLINMGYAHAKNYLNKSVSWQFENATTLSTTMADQGTTLHFRQQFKGPITLNETYYVTIQLSFFIRETGSVIIREQYSSVSLDGKNFISGYNNQLVCDRNGELESAFSFNLNSAIYTAKLKYQINNALSFLLGLEAKSAQIAISQQAESEKAGKFIQPISNRLKNSFYLNINAQAGWYKKLKAKKRIINALISS